VHCVHARQKVRGHTAGPCNLDRICIQNQQWLKARIEYTDHEARWLTGLKATSEYIRYEACQHGCTYAGVSMMSLERCSAGKAPLITIKLMKRAKQRISAIV
jgi:hypothetical protein